MTVQISCLHARGISDLPMGNVPGLQQLEVPVRDMIPYLKFHRDISDEYFKQLVGQLKPRGVPVFVYHRRANMRHLETRSQKGF